MPCAIVYCQISPILFSIGILLRSALHDYYYYPSLSDHPTFHCIIDHCAFAISIVLSSSSAVWTSDMSLRESMCIGLSSEAGLLPYMYVPDTVRVPAAMIARSRRGVMQLIPGLSLRPAEGTLTSTLRNENHLEHSARR